MPVNYKFKDIIYKDGVIKILSVRDGEMFLDVLKLENHSINEIGDPENLPINQIKSYYDAPYKSLEFKWPFIAYIYQNKEIVLFSANNPHKIFRFPMPFDS